MPTLYVDGRELRLDPSKALASGGEADVFVYQATSAIKVYKTAKHPSLAGDVQAQAAATARIVEHQRKLREFPSGLPEQVVVPQKLATNREGSQVLGYVMRLVQDADTMYEYGQRPFREQAGVDTNVALEAMRDLWRLVKECHALGWVLGDFNDLNVLVAKSKPYLIDADSWQFGSFLCKTYTEGFVDPLLCDPKETRPVLIKPHNQASDWYAYLVMLVQCLLYVGPFGGVYQPKEASKRVRPGERALKRITIMDPEVIYPRPAVPYRYLPDELLHHLHQVFAEDRRTVPTAQMLDIRWTRCTKCGTGHARHTCPKCKASAPAAVKATVSARGQVRCSVIFRSGTVVHAAVVGKDLGWLWWDGQSLRREGGSVVTNDRPERGDVYAILGDTSFRLRGGLLHRFEPGKPSACFPVEAFAVNADSLYWVEYGKLLREGPVAPAQIGSVMASQTKFWAGSAFGFGYWNAAGLQAGFVFPANGRGLNDSVKLPVMQGHVLASHCILSSELAWFLWTEDSGGRRQNRCVAVTASGQVVAELDASTGAGTWLGTLAGKYAIGRMLLCATDAGIVRVEAANGAMTVTKEWLDTAPYVDSGRELRAAGGALFVIDRAEIRKLQV